MIAILWRDSVLVGKSFVPLVFNLKQASGDSSCLLPNTWDHLCITTVWIYNGYRDFAIFWFVGHCPGPQILKFYPTFSSVKDIPPSFPFTLKTCVPQTS